jgi:chemotaxis protein histidine kinase CheA
MDEIVKPEIEQPTGLGLVGDKIINLAKWAQKEILSRWDEATMDRIKKNGIKLVEEANNFVISDKETYDAANEYFVRISQYKKEGGEFIEPLVEAMHQPHAVTCDIRREFYDPADMAKKIFEKKINEWKAEERKRAEAEQNRLNAERKAKEEAERQRLAEKARLEREKAEQERREAAERARLENEKAAQARREKEEAEAKARKAEEEKLAAERAAKNAKDEEARKIAQAEADRLKAEQEAAQAEAAERDRAAFESEQKAHKEISNGEIAAQEREQKAEAHETNSEAVFTPPSISLATVKKTEITSIGKAVGQKDWDVTIVDEMEIVRAVVKGVADGGFPLSVLNLDPERVKSALKRWAKMSVTAQQYEGNGVIIEATERLSARVNSKAKAAGGANG